MAARLLPATEAAAYCGLGYRRFRRIVESGQGPRAFNPDDGRYTLFATSVLDEWMHSRSDGQQAAS